MYFGVDYYPEHWPEERWEKDAGMMKEANINVVRLAEFAWAKIEPDEGVYDFSWLDRAIAVLALAGIKTVLGIPTAAAPKWLMDKHPDMYPVDMHGLVKGFGTRRHYCANHSMYREYTRKITAKMVEHYKDNPNIVAWQTDNEFGDNCYCDNCRDTFRTWLKKKHGTVEILNNEWGTVFWSQTYRSFDEVPVPGYSSSDGFSQTASGSALSTPYNHNPGLLLDYRRFCSDSYVAYQDIQIGEIRKRSRLPITHNYMGHYNELDYFKLGENLDFISWDNYPNNMWGRSDYKTTAMAHDLMRGIKNSNFWVMEQQSGPCGWHSMGDTPEPGQIRLWTYQAIAHGADAIVYFRWRACTFGIEKYWYGILDHDGIGRRRYREIQETGGELARLSELLVGSKGNHKTAIIKSYDNAWSHKGQPHNAKFDYNGLLQTYYNALVLNHVCTDVTSVDVDFSHYKLILMPAFNMVTEEIGQKCKAFVESGGNLLITFRSGTRTWNNKMSLLTVPGYFKDIAGVELEEFDSVNFGREVSVIGDGFTTKATTWCDVLTCTTSKPIAHYASHYYKGTPAVTLNEFGKGKVYYVACDMEEAALQILIRKIVDDAGVEPVLETPVCGLEAVIRENDGTKYIMLLNHNHFPVMTTIPGAYVDANTNNVIDGELEIPAYGVSLLKPFGMDEPGFPSKRKETT